MQDNTQFHLLQLTDISRLEPQAANTASLHASLPMYFIHSFEHPFCADAACRCSTQRQEIVRLFVKIVEGHFELAQVADLIDENGKENRA